MRPNSFLLSLLGWHLTSLVYFVGAQDTDCKDKCKDRCGVPKEAPRDAIQAFYYPWYSYSPDSKERNWRHWNAPRPLDGSTRFVPPHDLPSPFFPKLGAYSSSDTDTIETHMKWMKEAGIGVVIMSWWGIDSFEDKLAWDILNAAGDNNMKVTFYIEPHGGYMHKSPTANATVGSQTPYKAQQDVMYLIDTYGCHRAFHRQQGRPIFLFFASNLFMDGQEREWKRAWDELHANPIYNPFVITHTAKLRAHVLRGGWDGAHVYDCFAAVRMARHYKLLAEAFEAAGKMFYLTVCPGYDKSRHPPGDEPIVDREDGLLYEKLWQTAIESQRPLSVVVVSTFNEWHEGTAIEPAVPHNFESYQYNGDNFSSYVYSDYENAFGKTGQEAEMAYIVATKGFSDHFLNTTHADRMSGT